MARPPAIPLELAVEQFLNGQAAVEHPWLFAREYPQQSTAGLETRFMLAALYTTVELYPGYFLRNGEFNFTLRKTCTHILGDEITRFAYPRILQLSKHLGFHERRAPRRTLHFTPSPQFQALVAYFGPTTPADEFVRRMPSTWLEINAALVCMHLS